jgi:hypothetical protein
LDSVNLSCGQSSRAFGILSLVTRHSSL